MNKIFMFVALSISFACGQISISGKVTAEYLNGTPVVGAKVYLSNHPSVTVLTGAQGIFSLTALGIIRLQQGQVSSQAGNILSFNNGRIAVMSKEQQSMKIETFNSRGEQINTRDFNLIAGRNDINTANGLLSHGMYMVRAHIGNDCYTSTLLSMESIQWVGAKLNSHAWGLAKRQNYWSDYLMVSAKGYKLGYTQLKPAQSQYIQIAIGAFTPTGMKMISAKDSGFTMGSNGQTPFDSVSFTHDDYMDSTEVCQGDYSAVMQNTYATFSPPNWETHGKGDKTAAYFINWYDAILYCNARSKRDGVDTIYSYTQTDGIPGNGATLTGVAMDYQKNGYRLPTEAEWEYACRAGTKTDWYFDTAQAGNNAWFIINSQSTIYPVATKLPNHFGLYDMSGNIREWVNDWYGEYTSGLQADPIGTNTGTEKIWRGGSWDSNLNEISSIYRGHSEPSIGLANEGFRCVLSK